MNAHSTLAMPFRPELAGAEAPEPSGLGPTGGISIAFDLTSFMRRHGVIRISDNGAGFSVYMRGDILGTGPTVGDAFDNAVDQRTRNDEPEFAL